MAGQRLVGVAILLSAATACVPPGVGTQLAPQRGPKARVTANFTGGLTNRSAQARFSVESDAYVMVGHLAGDGFVRILYPSTPQDRGMARKGQTYSTKNVFARYDAIPGLYAARTVRYRHVAARMDSYDGAGNGYFFIVASKYPLNFDEISEGSFFDEIEVPNYFETYDPRLTVKALADLVADGSPYTLDFAGSFSAIDYSTAYDQQHDCLALSTVGLDFLSFGLASMPYYYAFGSSSMRSVFGRNGCASPFQYASLWRSRYYTNSYTPTLTPAPRLPPAPRGTIRPPWQRRVTPPPRRSAYAAAASAHLPDRINARRAANSWQRPRSPRSTSGGLDSWASRPRDASPSSSPSYSPPASRTAGESRTAESARPSPDRGSTERSPSSSESRKRDP